MPFRVSATAAGIQSLAAIIAKPDPSATTWSRLEPLPTSDDVSEALQARVADPLWMLARQWQFNEFQGEDAGSPIEAALRITGVPITSLVGDWRACRHARWRCRRSKRWSNASRCWLCTRNSTRRPGSS